MAELQIEWVQSPDDPTLSGNVVSYQIARSPGPNATAVVASVAAGADGDDTEYVDTVSAGTWYYRVRAVNDAGRRSLWSNEAQATVAVTQHGETPSVRIVIVAAQSRLVTVSGHSRSISIPAQSRTITA